MDDFLEIYAVRRHQAPFTVLYYLCWLLIIVFALAAAISVSAIVNTNYETGSIVFSWQNLVAALFFGGLAFLL